MEPIDPDNMTDEERKRVAHPWISWLIVILLVAAFLISVLK
jgi:hypothetical protein